MKQKIIYQPQLKVQSIAEGEVTITFTNIKMQLIGNRLSIAQRLRKKSIHALCTLKRLKHTQQAIPIMQKVNEKAVDEAVTRLSMIPISQGLKCTLSSITFFINLYTQVSSSVKMVSLTAACYT